MFSEDDMAELLFNAASIAPASLVNRNLMIDERSFSRFSQYRFGIYSVDWDHNGEIIKTVERNPITGQMFSPNRIETSMSLTDAVQHINHLVDNGETRPHGLILYMPDDLICIDFDGTDSPDTADDIRNRHYEMLDIAPTWIEKSASGVGRHAFYRLEDAEANLLTNTNNSDMQIDTRVRNGFVFLTGDMVRDSDFANFNSLPHGFKTYLYARCELSIEAATGSDARWLENIARSDAEVMKIFWKQFRESAEYMFDRKDQTGASEKHHQILMDLIKCSLNYEQVKRIYLGSECADFAYKSENRPQRTPESYQKWLTRNIHGAAQALNADGRFQLVGLVNLHLDDNPVEDTYSGFDMTEINDYTPTEWIVQNVIPSKGVVTVYGASGSGKTFLALDMMAAIANGLDWFDRHTKQVPVTYVGLEGEAGLRNRMYAYIKHHQRSANIFVITEKMDLRNGDDVMRLIKTIRQRGHNNGIVCIDTMAKSAPGMDENHSADMSSYIHMVEHIAVETGGCVMLIHHSGKDTDRGPRGHSSFLAGIDAAIQVMRESDDNHIRKWSTKKVKDGTDDAEERFILKQVEVGIDQWNEPAHSCIVEAAPNINPLVNGLDVTDEDCRLLAEMMMQVTWIDHFSLKKGARHPYKLCHEMQMFPRTWNYDKVITILEVGCVRHFFEKYEVVDASRNVKECIGVCH